MYAGHRWIIVKRRAWVAAAGREKKGNVGAGILAFDTAGGRSEAGEGVVRSSDVGAVTGGVDCSHESRGERKWEDKSNCCSCLCVSSLWVLLLYWCINSNKSIRPFEEQDWAQTVAIAEQRNH